MSAIPVSLAHQTEQCSNCNGSAFHVGFELIQKKCLRNRMTIVPLDKTRPKVLDQRTQDAAARTTHDSALLALQLVDYKPEVKVAMQYAFGTAFICDDEHAARKVMEDGSVASRGISLAGDDYNPNGVLTGGSRSKTSHLLKLQELQQIDDKLERHEVWS